MFHRPPHSIRLVMPGDWRGYKPVYKILICRHVTFLQSVQNPPKYLCIIKAESSQFTDFKWNLNFSSYMHEWTERCGCRGWVQVGESTLPSSPRIAFSWYTKIFHLGPSAQQILPAAISPPTITWTRRLPSGRPGQPTILRLGRLTFLFVVPSTLTNVLSLLLSRTGGIWMLPRESL